MKQINEEKRKKKKKYYYNMYVTKIKMFPHNL